MLVDLTAAADSGVSSGQERAATPPTSEFADKYVILKMSHPLVTGPRINISRNPVVVISFMRNDRIVSTPQYMPLFDSIKHFHMEALFDSKKVFFEMAILKRLSWGYVCQIQTGTTDLFGESHHIIPALIHCGKIKRISTYKKAQKTSAFRHTSKALHETAYFDSLLITIHDDYANDSVSLPYSPSF